MERDGIVGDPMEVEEDLLGWRNVNVGGGQAQPHHRGNIDKKWDDGKSLSPVGVPLPASGMEEY